MSRLDVCEGTLSVSVSSYRWRPSRLSLLQVPRRTQPCRPPRPLRSRSNAPTRPVCSPSGYPTRQISHSAPVAPCTAHLCPTPCAQHVQPLNVPVREPVHVQYWAVAWSDRVGLLGLALAGLLRLPGRRTDVLPCVTTSGQVTNLPPSPDPDLSRALRKITSQIKTLHLRRLIPPRRAPYPKQWPSTCQRRRAVRGIRTRMVMRPRPTSTSSIRRSAAGIMLANV